MGRAIRKPERPSWEPETTKRPDPVPVGFEAIGPMQWFLNLLEELGIECKVGDATKIQATEPRQQKHDRRDVELILKLLVKKRFPTIWDLVDLLLRTT